MLKDLVFSIWHEGGCEGFADTAKSVGLVDFYLPFFPLERHHIQELFHMKLRERASAAHAEGLPNVTWGEEVVEFLTSKVCVHLACMLRLRMCRWWLWAWTCLSVWTSSCMNVKVRAHACPRLLGRRSTAQRSACIL